MKFNRTFIVAIAFLQFVATRTFADDSENRDGPTPKEIHFFETRIRPVLVKHCYECHSDQTEKSKGGLRVDTAESIRRGGESGSSFDLENPDQSLLLKAIEYEEFEMPPKGKLPSHVVADIREWIEMGVPDPRSESSKPIEEEPIDWEEERKFWSFQSPQLQKLPRLKKTDVQNRIDFFVLAKLEQKNLAFGPQASDRELFRRLSYDLTGLPPTHQQTLEFIRSLKADPAQRTETISRWIDQLINSPRFGENWARMWLDVARFAEDQAHIVGNNQSLFYPNGYIYRDWVIEAFNSDLQYDRFIKDQLAKDLAEKFAKVSGNESAKVSAKVSANESAKDDAKRTAAKPKSTKPKSAKQASAAKKIDQANDAESDPLRLASLGFLGLGPKYYRRNDIMVKAEEWEDRVDVVSRGLLGLTVACARCHDHKFDAIPTSDYYALAGIFSSTDMYNMPLKSVATKDGKKKKKNSPGTSIHIVRDYPKPADVPVFIRGDTKSKGEIVPRRFLTVLSKQVYGAPKPRPADKDAAKKALDTETFDGFPKFRKGSGRLELADAIANFNNPLTARVIVNRIFGKLTGKPIVSTPSNFGKLGAAPTHVKLLDDLSVRFMQNDWSMKWLIREIVTSRTYQQSSISSAKGMSIDPDNRLFWRMNRRRLSVEQFRDSVLTSSRSLENRVGGKSMDPLDLKSHRRTVYSFISRFELNQLLTLFDFPDPNAHAAKRNQTITPLQKMFVLNSPFMLEHSKRLVQNIRKSLGEDQDQKVSIPANKNRADNSQDRFIQQVYETIFFRQPDAQEMELGAEFLAAAHGDSENEALYVQALLISNEFLYVD